MLRNICLAENEARHLCRFLEELSAHQGNNGCNDYPVENTDANWRLYLEMNKNEPPEELANRPPPGESIYLYDFVLVGYFKGKIEDAFQDVEGWGE